MLCMNRKNFEEVKLSKDIQCDALIIQRMVPDTIKLANCIIKGITDDGPAALIVQITDINHLHAALALPNAPIAQGADANESLHAFRAWLLASALLVRPDSQFPTESAVSLAFHHLAGPDAVSMCYQHWSPILWLSHLLQNRDGPMHERIGQFAIIFWVEGTGRHRASISIAPRVFG
jgi:hypothetical protein